MTTTPTSIDGIDATSATSATGTTRDTSPSWTSQEAVQDRSDPHYFNPDEEYEPIDELQEFGPLGGDAGAANNLPSLTTEQYEYRVYGPPGCGKTTYLSRQVRRALQNDLKPLVVSLTRAAALEVADRGLPLDSDEVGTLHSYCHRQLGRPALAENDQQLRSWNETHPQYAISPARSRTVDHDNLDYAGANNPGDRYLSIYQLYRSRMLPTQFKSKEIQDFADKWERWKLEQGVIDFNDLIKEATEKWDEAPSRPEVIFVDEAQDLDYQQMHLLRKWGQAAGRLVVIGDPNQNLYRWRGSDPGAFNDPPLPSDRLRVLAQSYRVPYPVHRVAYNWISRSPGNYPAEYRPRPGKGELRQLFLGDKIFGMPHQRMNDSWREAETLMNDARKYLDQDKSVMILASCSFMLEPIIDRLKLEGLPFHNPRRDNNGRWNPIQRMPGKVTAADRLEAFLGLYEEGIWKAEQLRQWTQVLQATRSSEEGRQPILLNQGYTKKALQLLEDCPEGGLNPDILEAMLTPEALEAGMTGDLSWFRGNLLSSANPQAYDFPINVIQTQGLQGLKELPKITIGTIHSVKGTEADVVYVFPDLSLKGRGEWFGEPEDQAGVYRLFYVGFTRARESLIICRPRPVDRT